MNTETSLSRRDLTPRHPPIESIERGGGGIATQSSADGRRPGVCYSVTPDGLELPVLDVMIPAFALPLDRAGAVEVIEDYVRAEAQLAAAPTAPLHLVNIGGGPAPDSLNALILLHKRHPGSLASRRTRIHVLDRDDQGPAFGASALAALRRGGGPLHALDVELEHVRYDWADTAVLDRALREATSAGGMIACSAEGSLFDYGSDEEIVANLRSLHGGTPPGALVVGSVTRGGTAARRVRRASGIRVRPREWDGFVSLVQAAGWTVARVIETPVGYHVLLAKAGTAWTR